MYKRQEYEVWRAGIVERRNKINTECVSALDKTDSKAKQGPVTGPSDLPKQYDGIMGKAEKLKDWTYANTLGAIRLFDWIGHGLGKFDSAFSRYCVDEVNAAYDTKLRHIQERHDAMNAKMKELGITSVSYTHLDVYKRQGLLSRRPPSLVPGRTRSGSW